MDGPTAYSSITPTVETSKYKYIGSIRILNNYEYRYNNINIKNSKFENQDLLTYEHIGKGQFKTFYTLKKTENSPGSENYVYGRYKNNKREDDGLRKQKKLKDLNSSNQYIPDIIENGRLSDTEGEFEQYGHRKYSYVIMERVNGIEFDDLVNFVLKNCLKYNSNDDCEKFKTIDELKGEGVNESSVQFKFFSEVILQPLDKRVKILKYLFQELLNAVKVLHDSGTLHLDIKLPNMMIIYDVTEPNQYEKFKVKIIDFGLGKNIGSKIETTSVGTPYYFNKKLIKTLPKLWQSALIKDCNKPSQDFQDFQVKFEEQVNGYVSYNSYEVTDDIYPLGLILQVMFVLTILTPKEFNNFFEKEGISLRDNIAGNKWNVARNSAHMIGHFDHIKYIYKNIIELFLLSENENLSTLTFDNVNKLFTQQNVSTNTFKYFHNLKEELKLVDDISASIGPLDYYYIDLLEIDDFYYRNQETGSDADTKVDNKAKIELFQKFKTLSSASGDGTETKKNCQQCFLLLRIFRKMLGSGYPDDDYDEIGKILADLNKFDNTDGLVEVQNKELKFVFETILAGGSHQVGGAVFSQKMSASETTKITKSSSDPTLSNSQPQSEETQVIDFKNLQSEKVAVNRLFQKYYHSSFNMNNEKSNNIFIKPISRIPYVKTEPFTRESNPRKSTIQGQRSEETNVDLDKTIGMIDREVCYEILNDTDTFSGDINKTLQNELKKAFGFTETKTAKKAGGFRKKRKSSKTNKRQSSKTNKRQSSKTNKRQSSKTKKRKSSKTNKRKSNTLRNKITSKNKKYKNVSKRKNHLKVNKTKITKKKIKK